MGPVLACPSPQYGGLCDLLQICFNIWMHSCSAKKDFSFAATHRIHHIKDLPTRDNPNQLVNSATEHEPYSFLELFEVCKKCPCHQQSGLSGQQVAFCCFLCLIPFVHISVFLETQCDCCVLLSL